MNVPNCAAPNILIFGLFTFLPLFMNFGFSVTDGTSINFENRDFSGLDNLARITQEVQIDTGGENVEDDKFKAAMADTFVFVILQVPIMILIALDILIIDPKCLLKEIKSAWDAIPHEVREQTLRDNGADANVG